MKGQTLAVDGDTGCAQTVVRRKELLVAPPTAQLHVGSSVWMLREKRKKE